MDRNLKQRTFEYSLRIIALSQHLPNSKEGTILTKQLVRSGASIGANVEEAEAAYTKDEFAYKMNIALKEALETHYWLRLLKESRIDSSNRLDGIIDETEELKKILGAIVSKARGRSK